MKGKYLLREVGLCAVVVLSTSHSHEQTVDHNSADDEHAEQCDHDIKADT